MTKTNLDIDEIMEAERYADNNDYFGYAKLLADRTWTRKQDEIEAFNERNEDLRLITGGRK